MRLLKLTEKVREMVIQELITAGHARAIVSITDPKEQEEIAQKIVDYNLSVRDTAKIVRNLGKPTKKKQDTKRVLSFLTKL